MSRVLVTGGAGFIGSFVVEELLSRGHEVRVLDVLDPQVHEGGSLPEYLGPDVELLIGDVRDEATLDAALARVDAVVHLAAAVGVGQSMYQLRRYVDVNSGGTAALLQALGRHGVERLVVASSMSIYGEGAYSDGEQTVFAPSPRSREQLAARAWELRGPGGAPLTPVPTGEEKTPQPASPYALTKYDQELLCLMYGAAYRVSTVALRLFNVYGPRQALSNPYTGVMAIFACRLLNDEPPIIFEDGAQLRDFVSVRDVARAFALAVEHKHVGGCALNVGSGSALSINGVAGALAQGLGRDDMKPLIQGTYRVGDVRHCYADISRASSLLGYRPQVGFEAGVGELADWLSRQRAVDRAPIAAAELASRGLTL
jgi:dTDP-L-rhamnose 4-epimerase